MIGCGQLADQQLLMALQSSSPAIMHLGIENAPAGWPRPHAQAGRLTLGLSLLDQAISHMCGCRMVWGVR